MPPLDTASISPPLDGVLMTAREAAAYLRVHVQTVYGWHATRGMPAQRVGRSLRFRKADLDRWLADSAAKKSA